MEWSGDESMGRRTDDENGSIRVNSEKKGLGSHWMGEEVHSGETKRLILGCQTGKAIARKSVRTGAGVCPVCEKNISAITRWERSTK